jgi:hypothetical protein
LHVREASVQVMAQGAEHDAFVNERARWRRVPVDRYSIDSR